MEKMFLNLGCGGLPIKDAFNVDFFKYEYVDEVVDLKIFPWPWQDNSIDGIYMIHFLEHCPDFVTTIKECHRILKKGGFLHLQVPHSSCIGAVGNLQHYRTFAFDTIENTICKPTIFFDKQLFQTVIPAKIYWLQLPRNSKNPYIKFKINRKMHSLMIGRLSELIRPIIQYLINLSPYIFERGWCYYVGGADEVVWKGIKI